MQYVRRGEDWAMRGGALGLEAAVQSEHFGIEIPMADIYTLVFDAP